MQRTWRVQQAKARFSELLRKSLAEGPQIVTCRGVETAVVVPIEQWRRMEGSTRRNIKEWLLAPEARTEKLAPPRAQFARRQLPTFDYPTVYLLDADIVPELRRRSLRRVMSERTA